MGHHQLPTNVRVGTAELLTRPRPKLNHAASAPSGPMWLVGKLKERERRNDSALKLPTLTRSDTVSRVAMAAEPLATRSRASTLSPQRRFPLLSGSTVPSNISDVRQLVHQLEVRLAAANGEPVASLEAADSALRELARQLFVHLSGRGALAERLRQAQRAGTEMVMRVARLASAERELRRLEREICDLAAESEAIILATRSREASLAEALALGARAANDAKVLAQDAKRRFARSKAMRDASAHERVLMIIFGQQHSKAPAAAGAESSAAGPAKRPSCSRGGSEAALPVGFELAELAQTRSAMVHELIAALDADERLATLAHALQQPWARPLLERTAAAKLGGPAVLRALERSSAQLQLLLGHDLCRRLRADGKGEMQALMALLLRVWRAQGEDVPGLRLGRLYNALPEAVRLRVIGGISLRTDREAEAFTLHEEDVPLLLSDEWEVPPRPGQAHAGTQLVLRDLALVRSQARSRLRMRAGSIGGGSGSSSDSTDTKSATRSKAAAADAAAQWRSRPDRQGAPTSPQARAGPAVEAHALPLVGAPAAHSRAAVPSSRRWEEVGLPALPLRNLALLAHGAAPEPMDAERVVAVIAELCAARLRLLLASARRRARVQPWAPFAQLHFVKQTGARCARAGATAAPARAPGCCRFLLLCELSSPPLPIARRRHTRRQAQSRARGSASPS